MANYIYIIDEQNEQRVYLAELKGDLYYTTEKAHAKTFATYESAAAYKQNHRVQVGTGRIVEIF